MAPFRGALGAFQKFDRALTETEVEGLMKTMPIPKLPPASPALEIARSDSGQFNVKAWRSGNYGARMADGKRLSWNVPAVPEPFEVKVVNLWPNRLIGDELLPEDSERNPDGTLVRWPQWLEEGRPSPTGRQTFVTWRAWKRGSALQQSGLLGPVSIIGAKEIFLRQ